MFSFFLYREHKFFEDIQPGELYAFDIDVGKVEENDDHARYSVDATHSGNWTQRGDFKGNQI